MIKNSISRTLALAVIAAFAVTGCTNASQAGTASSSSANGTADAAASSGNSVAVNEEARALLPEAIKTKAVLTIASDPTYPPFEYYDTDNKTMIGWDVDMGDTLAATLGLKAEHVPATFDTILPGLTSKKYDLGMSTFSITAERKKQVDFVTYLKGGSAVAVKPGNPDKLAVNAEAMCGKAIAAQKGSSQSLEILPKFDKQCTDAGKPAIDIQLFPTQNDANLALVSGRVQGVMADSVSLAYQGKLAGGKFEVAPGPDYEPQPTGLALPKNSDLRPAIEAAMKSIIESPKYMEINNKWDLPEGTYITVDEVVQK